MKAVRHLYQLHGSPPFRRSPPSGGALFPSVAVPGRASSCFQVLNPRRTLLRSAAMFGTAGRSERTTYLTTRATAMIHDAPQRDPDPVLMTILVHALYEVMQGFSALDVYPRGLFKHKICDARDGQSPRHKAAHPRTRNVCPCEKGPFHAHRLTSKESGGPASLKRGALAPSICLHAHIE